MPTDPVLVALQQQVDGYRKLARLAEAQRRHVRGGATQALLDVLQQRQAVLDTIVAADRVVAPAKRAWPAFKASLTAEGRQAAERMLGETAQLLEQITAGDRDDAVVLQQRKLDLGRQINKASAAKAVNRNYAAAAYGSARPTMDLQS